MRTNGTFLTLVLKGITDCLKSSVMNIPFLQTRMYIYALKIISQQPLKRQRHGH